MSKLDLFDERETYVAWVDEEGEAGGHVGQDCRDSLSVLARKLDAAKAKRDFEEYEYVAVEIAAAQWVKASPEGVDLHYGYTFESMGVAKKFLTAMRAAQKIARSEFEIGVPWPEWAKQAKTAGWKPPKGWKP